MEDTCDWTPVQNPHHHLGAGALAAKDEADSARALQTVPQLSQLPGLPTQETRGRLAPRLPTRSVCHEHSSVAAECVKADA